MTLVGSREGSPVGIPVGESDIGECVGDTEPQNKFKFKSKAILKRSDSKDLLECQWVTLSLVTVLVNSLQALLLDELV